jgi:LacI family transcriptional regulator
LISSQCDHSKTSAHYFDHKIFSVWNKPIVVLNLEVKRSHNVSVVTFSNYDAALNAVTHLIKTKRRRIALVYGDKSFEDSSARFEGYEAALRDHHLPIQKAMIKKGDYSEASGYAATIELFKQKDEIPDAIFCTNDEMAIGAIHALEVLRIRCPQEVAVMGFDGLTLGQYTRPRLSTVTQPIKEIAKTGTELLIDLIEKRVKGPDLKMIPSQLILRESA